MKGLNRLTLTKRLPYPHSSIQMEKYESEFYYISKYWSSSDPRLASVNPLKPFGEKWEKIAVFL